MKKIKFLKKNTNHFNANDLIADLKSLGIKKNDIVFVHSSLSKIGYVEKGANAVIDALLNVIGENGTLVIPTYFMMGTMYNTCTTKNYIFNLKKSPTVLGAIPSEFLKRKGISRSIHPTHSISAIGMYAEEITDKHHIGNKTFGENSPWEKVLKLNGIILGIGINLAWTTQYHYVEDIMGDDFPIKVKVDNNYKIKCKINENEYINVIVQPLDPEIAKTRIEKNPFNLKYITEICRNLGILTYGRIGEALSWWVDAKKFIDILIKLANIGITIYTTEEEFKKNKLYPYGLIKDKLN